MTTSLAPLVALDAVEHMNRELHHELREAHAQNLALRAVLAEHGIDAPVPSGVVTLTRLRALEDVRDLAVLHLRAPSEATERELREATVTAGRAP